MVHQRYVITAAHCLYTKRGTRMTPSNGEFRVVVGEHNRCDGVNEGGQLLLASRVHEHPSYSNTGLDNDIAILEVAIIAKPNLTNHCSFPGILPSMRESSLCAFLQGKEDISAVWEI